MAMLPTTRAQRMHARGLTLVELLISVTVGVAILLGLTVLLAYNSGNQQDLERTIRQLESARFALDEMAEDLMQAGYFSDFNPNDLAPAPVWQTPDPCSTDLTLALQGWTSTGSQMPVAIEGISPVNALACLDARQRLAGTEAFIVRRADTTEPPLGIADSRTDNLYIQVSRCTTDTQRVLVARRPAGDPALTFNLRLPDCATPNDQIRRVSQRVYFIAACSDCAANDGIPTLKRVEFVDGSLRTTSIAEGIENLQLEYLLDTNVVSPGPEEVVTVGGVTNVPPRQWQNVVAVRLHLLARSDRANPDYRDTRRYLLGPNVAIDAPADGFKRVVLTSTVRLVNISGRRE